MPPSSELLAVSVGRSVGSLVVAGLVTLILGCNGNSLSVSSNVAASSMATPSVASGPTATAGPCAVTVPRNDMFPPILVAPDPSVLPVPWVDTWYGNEAIWVRLPTDGILPAAPDPGRNTLSTKFPWWRVLSGQLLATGRSTDGSTGELQASVGSVDEYGPNGFVSSILTFDHAGCWEITASLNGRTLSFVTRVEARQL